MSPTRALVGWAVINVAHGLRTGTRQQLPRSIGGVLMENYREYADDFMVVFKAGTSDSDMQGMCKGRCNLMGHPNDGGVAFAKVRGYSQMEQLVSDNAGSVEVLEPDAVDFMIPELEMSEGPSALAASWGLDRIGVPDASATGRGVHIYVQDTGIRVSHSDFGGRAVAAMDMTGDTVWECTGYGSCAQDKQGHGTHCAGTTSGSSFGVAKEAKVYAVKTLSDEGSGARSWQISGIDWVTSRGKRPAVLSMSLGGAGTDRVYTTAIDAATEAGVVVVVAAGNSDGNSCAFSPAFVQSAITVGATDSKDDRAYYSNWGTCNNIMAPGTNIISAAISSDQASVSLTGTSMACPHTAGAAALLLQQNPGWKSPQVLASMQNSARTGFIAGLKYSDPDYFLWVSGSPAPPSAPTPAPPPTPPPPKCPFFTVSSEPDANGDCSCKRNLFCSLDGVNRNCPSSAGPGGWGGYYFLPTCTSCRCFFEF